MAAEVLEVILMFKHGVRNCSRATNSTSWIGRASAFVSRAAVAMCIMMASETVATGQQMLPVEATHSGWWDNTGFHDSTNENFAIGRSSMLGVLRDYVRFDLSTISGNVTSATLRLSLSNAGYFSADSSETATFYDVTNTSLSDLTHSGSGRTDIYADLGSGVEYGSVVVSPSMQGSIVDIPLNASAITAINAGLQGPFAIGGALSTLTGGLSDEYIFGSSGVGTQIRTLLLNGALQVMCPSYSLLTQWVIQPGGGSFGPVGVAVDPSGNVFVAWESGQRIEKFDNSGSLLATWGNGAGSGDGQFNMPLGVAVDMGGNVFVVDLNNYRVQKFDNTGVYLGQWSVGASTWTIAVDVNGNVFVGDAGGNIRKFDGNGNPLTIWHAIPAGDWPSIATDAAGNVFVPSAVNAAIYKFDNNGTLLTTWGNLGSGDGQFGGTSVIALAVDGAGNVFAEDASNARVQKFDNNGNFLTSWHISGTGYGIALDSDNEVFIAAYGEGLMLKYRTAECSDERISLARSFGNSGLGIHANPTTKMMADPVNSATGSFYHAETDVTLPGVGAPFVFTRSYNSADSLTGAFGYGWTASYQENLVVRSDGTVVFRADDGQQLVFAPQGNGAFRAEPGVFSTLVATATGYELVRRDLVRDTFDANGQLVAQTDRNGQTLTLGRDTSGALTTISDTASRVLAVAMDGDGHITSLTLPDGRSVQYAYAGDLLTAATDLGGKTTHYEYDAAGRLSAIIDPNGHTLVANTYGVGGRVTDQYDALGGLTTFAWDAETETSTMTDARGGIWQDVYLNNVLQQSIDALGQSKSYTYDAAFNVVAWTDARGNTTTMTYDGAGNVLTRTAPAPLGYVETFTYDAQNKVLTATDPRGATTTFTYDARGNRTTSVAPDGTLTSYGYDARGLRTAMTDARGATTTYAYDAAGNVTRVTSPLGHAVTMTYDAAGRRTSEVEVRGNEPGADADTYRTRFTYDAMDRLLTVTDPLGHTTTSTYDAVANLLATTDATGAITTFAYDAANRRVSETGPNGGTTTFAYDPSGHLVETRDPLGASTQYAYDAAGRRVGVVTARGTVPGGDPASFRWQYTYDANGNLAQVIDPLGHTTTSTWDVINRRVSVTDPLSRTTTYAYDAAGNRTSATDAVGATTTSSYDLRHRVTAVTDPTGRTTSVTYDPASNRTAITSPLGETTTFTYDAENRRSAMVDARGNVPGATASVFQTSFAYDPAGRLTRVTDPLGHVTDTAFDPVGNLTATTDANGHTTRYTYDAANRLATVTGPDGAISRYTYNSSGELTGRTDPNGHVSTYTYDLARRRTETVSPLGQRWTSAYDPEGNTIRLIDPRGHAAADSGIGTVQYEYDAVGRLLVVDYGDDTPDVAYSLNAAGELEAMADGQGTSGHETYLPDGVGRRTMVTRDTQSITYEYDAASRVTSRTYPTAKGGKPFATSVMYDGDGRLATETMNGSLVATVTYDPTGALATRTFGNGVAEQRTYDPAGRLLNVTHTYGTKIVARFDYAYDAVGNPTSVTSLAGTESYTYDAADRLTGVCYTAACTEPGSFLRYTYDGVGNRLTEIRSTGTTVYTYDAADQLVQTSAPGVGVTDFDYDPAGNEIQAGATSYRYDLANRLLSVDGAKDWVYTYDGNGRRLTVARTDAKPTTRFLWDTNGSLPLLALELKANGAELRRYLYGLGPLAMGKGEQLTYYHQDALGSVRAATKGKGKLVGTLAYEPFGAVRGKPKGPLAKTPLQFTGEYRDLTTGLYHLRARQYDARTGRFLGRDPLPAGQFAPIVGAYAYANNQPTVLVDPSGKRPECWIPMGGHRIPCPAGFRGWPNHIKNFWIAQHSDDASFAAHVDPQAGTDYPSFFDTVNYQTGGAQFLIGGSQCLSGTWDGGSRGGACLEGGFGAVQLSLTATSLQGAPALGRSLSEWWAARAAVSAGSSEAANAAKGALLKQQLAAEEAAGARLPSEITGYTRHGLEQATGRDGGVGVAERAITDAFDNPLEITGSVDHLGRPGFKLVGRDATVVVNPNGEIVTTYANNTAGIRFR